MIDEQTNKIGQTEALMQALARGIDEALNGTVLPRRNGFALLTFPLNREGDRVNYISNGDRADMIAALKEIVARFEGQPRQAGRA